MKSKFQFPIAAAAALAVSSGCDRNQQETSETDGQPGATVTAKEVAERYKAAAVATKDYVVENKVAFVAGAENRLKQLDAQIDELAKKSEGLKEDAKLQTDQALAELRAQRDKLDVKFAQLKQSGDKAWKELKAGFEMAMNDLEQAFENARSEFN